MTGERPPDTGTTGLEVAIIGMSGRFPGARTIEQFWTNLIQGVESISSFSDDQLRASGVSEAMMGDPGYVRARGVLENVEMFDADFFGLYPKEAECMDPQQRLFLECAWEAMERAGYYGDGCEGLVGVFGGVGMNNYLLPLLATRGRNYDPAEGYQLVIGNEKDFLATRVSYKLNLRGPSVVIQTACSTSLVAVHMAVQSLMSYQCDMALAGGATISLPQDSGYLYQEGMILSPDGRCRAFDARAQGTVAGNGVAVVVLKRLADALADHDPVIAVIKGSACNNDGSLRVGYTSPGVEGQAEVIASAQALAGVDPSSITYVEAHGTGTPLGDPIEIAALTQTFRQKTTATEYCAIGSVKTNVGHLDAAAGATGLIKTALSLQHRTIPASLHFEEPNPRIDFAHSPFYVVRNTMPWKTDGVPRRAGVSSFGIGGTNAHVVLEEAPPVPSSPSARPCQLVCLSAKTDSALDAMSTALAEHGRPEPESDLADASYTLHVGRKPMRSRRIAVASSWKEAREILDTRDPKRLLSMSHRTDPAAPGIAFMFPGQGSQHVAMGRGVYDAEPAFREAVDVCCRTLKRELGRDLRDVIFAAVQGQEESERLLTQTAITQPALFVFEYAMARLLMEWGIRPDVMVGHSIGEYVAACLADVMTLEEALHLVAVRGRLMQSVPPGSMLSIPMDEAQARPLLKEGLTVAAINAPGSCVVSGPNELVELLERELTEKGVDSRRLHTSHAFHSAMMDPILKTFEEEVARIPLRAPLIPCLSNLTGTLLSDSDATDPRYWVRHLRHTVRFADDVGEILKSPGRILLEVGPGQVLSSLARRHPESRGRLVVATMRHPQEPGEDMAVLLTALGKLWLAGCRVDWKSFYRHEERKRILLPTYPFERKRFWLEAKTAKGGSGEDRTDISSWFYAPSWKRCDSPADATRQEKVRYLVFPDDTGIGETLCEGLRGLGAEVTTVRAGSRYEQISDRHFVVPPADRDAYVRLLKRLNGGTGEPHRIIHCWALSAPTHAASPVERIAHVREKGFTSLTALGQAMLALETPITPEIVLITSGACDVTGGEPLQPEGAILTGPARVIPQEIPGVRCRTVDLAPASADGLDERFAGQLLLEVTRAVSDSAVAYRGGHRWVQSFEALPIQPSEGMPHLLREGGTYLITGGLGRIGRQFAEFLAGTTRGTIVLLDRVPFPPPEAWTKWIEEHGADDATSRRISQLRAMEHAGARLMVLQADVVSEQEMRQAFQTAAGVSGRIDGIIHCAGTVGADTIRTIHEIAPADIDAQFQAKVHGLRVLTNVLGKQPADFVILQSSLASVLGGLGFAAYAAANAYMDAVAALEDRAGRTRWISVNWDAWQEEAQPAGRRQAGAGLPGTAIEPAEGIEVLRRILSVRAPSQVLVSVTDLGARLETWVRRESPAEALEKAASPRSEPAALYDRPQLQTAYVAPSTELELQIAAVWQDLLGIDRIGIYDNFFELGGNSLLGTQLAAKLRSAFHVQLPLRSLFEDPTVACVARIITAERSAVEPEADKIAEALRAVQTLTEDEVRTRLAGGGTA